MRRHPGSRCALVWAAFAAWAGPAPAQPSGTAPAPPRAPAPAAAPAPPSLAILQALREHPVTAPYRFAVTSRGGQTVLSGRVGTKTAHDAAIRTLTALGYFVRDDLVIDTAEAYRAATPVGVGLTPVGVAFAPPNGLPYVYPPPIMGRIDEPFYGFEPPTVSYPPWWGAVAAREPLNLAALNAADDPAAMTPADPNAAATPPGTVEMTLDPRGVAVLRGTVPTLADRTEPLVLEVAVVPDTTFAP